MLSDLNDLFDHPKYIEIKKTKYTPNVCKKKLHPNTNIHAVTRLVDVHHL